jgi:phosphate transport system permease protein
MDKISPMTRPNFATPWKKRSTRSVLEIVAASVVPASITLGFILFGFDGALATTVIFLPLQVIWISILGFRTVGRSGVQDGILAVMTIFLTSLVMVLLLSVLWSVISQGLKVMSLSFITQNNRFISSSTSLEYGGIGHAILGTLIAVGITTLVAVPLGLGIAVFLTETRSKLRGSIRILIQAMSGLPSIVAGLFIYSAFLATGILGYSLLAGALSLIPLMLPTVARVAEEALRLVPRELRNGALALGASSFSAFFQVTLPAAISGVVTALLLGLARVIGETAPMLLTVGLANITNVNPLEAAATLPTYIYGFLGLGKDTSLARAWGAALAVLIIVAIIFSIARLASRPRKAKRKASK